MNAHPNAELIGGTDRLTTDLLPGDLLPYSNGIVDMVVAVTLPTSGVVATITVDRYITGRTDVVHTHFYSGIAAKHMVLS